MILILLFILAAVIILGCLLAGRVIYPQKFGFEETLHIEVEKGRIDDIDWNALRRVKESSDHFPWHYLYTFRLR
jgi:hypothetical protein